MGIVVSSSRIGIGLESRLLDTGTHSKVMDGLGVIHRKHPAAWDIVIIPICHGEWGAALEGGQIAQLKLCVCFPKFLL
jgi:hypothetical protein